MRSASDMRVYWGGVMFGPGPDPTMQSPEIDGNAVGYVKGVYHVLADEWNLAGGTWGAWPWDGINIHVHLDRGTDHFANIFQAVRGEMVGNGDSGRLLVGEWGVHRGTPLDNMTHAFEGISSNPSVGRMARADAMFYFSHQAFEDPAPWGIVSWQTMPPDNYYYEVTGETDLYPRFDDLVGA